MSERKDITAGTVITFGRYLQHSTRPCAPEPIEWIVLDTDGQTAVLISKYALEEAAYHDEQCYVTWETCTLRAWLNSEFLYEAFTDEEQAQIRTVSVTTCGYAQDDTYITFSTQDKVWLLSAEEAERYFASDEERKCLPTESALSYDTVFWKEVYGEGLECPWWLRSAGDSPDHASVVTDEGIVFPDGWTVSTKDAAVRPVIVLLLADRNCIHLSNSTS